MFTVLTNTFWSRLDARVPKIKNIESLSQEQFTEAFGAYTQINISTSTSPTPKKSA